tara:strand:- start:220 stop:639 length:420 start_codon:yes stop_codon:yes gene_type:complete
MNIMKNLKNNLTVRVETYISLSEDYNKVLLSLNNITCDCKFTLNNNIISSENSNLNSLLKIFNQIRDKQTFFILRRLLNKNKYKNQTWFLLNKQAAFMNKIVLCDDELDSPLGPIKIILESDDIDHLINSLINNQFLLK